MRRPAPGGIVVQLPPPEVGLGCRPAPKLFMPFFPTSITDCWCRSMIQYSWYSFHHLFVRKNSMDMLIHWDENLPGHRAGQALGMSRNLLKLTGSPCYARRGGSTPELEELKSQNAWSDRVSGLCRIHSSWLLILRFIEHNKVDESAADSLRTWKFACQVAHVMCHVTSWLDKKKPRNVHRWPITKRKGMQRERGRCKHFQTRKTSNVGRLHRSL